MQGPDLSTELDSLPFLCCMHVPSLKLWYTAVSHSQLVLGVATVGYFTIWDAL